ncbi:hypothetical protein [Yersinia mollaretii]|uniref:hypothetical protein n=1 Tax=Yersinia mollaretii TaxID=33060 RepID=UPI000321BFE5|nr:hypothetical protein [Yersinia mollaretii]QKJ02299.1 hypothetical protein HRD69_04435 [Yersinia mollaretii ATCC 43969]
MECFKNRYSQLKKNFKLGHIIYGLSVDTSSALEALSNIGFHRRENRKDNILVQNSLTNAVFGLVPSPGVWRSDDEIQRDLNDGQRGLDFKANAFNAGIFSRIEWKDKNPEEFTNKLWGRTSKQGISFQIFERDLPVHLIVDTSFSALLHIVRKDGIEGRCVTASEIRYIYRRKHLFRVRKNIKIYTADREVRFEEFFEHEYWSQYNQKSSWF